MSDCKCQELKWTPTSHERCGDLFMRTIFQSDMDKARELAKGIPTRMGDMLAHQVVFSLGEQKARSFLESLGDAPALVNGLKRVMNIPLDESEWSQQAVTTAIEAKDWKQVTRLALGSSFFVQGFQAASNKAEVLDQDDDNLHRAVFGASAVNLDLFFDKQKLLDKPELLRFLIKDTRAIKPENLVKLKGNAIADEAIAAMMTECVNPLHFVDDLELFTRALQVCTLERLRMPVVRAKAAARGLDSVISKRLEQQET